jgi:hypothetical protein
MSIIENNLITKEYLEQLVANCVPEGKTIEYKQALLGNSYEEKREFLADVSSFANADGGHIFYGIKEEDGIAKELCGLENINPDSEILRMENVIRDCIKPRISISLKELKLDSTHHVIIAYIPRSWLQPHVVEIDNHWRFYSRNSKGKYPLDVGELRSSFLLTETFTQSARLFRAERLSKIISGETPMSLLGSSKLVLHIVPMNAFSGIRYPVHTLEKHWAEISFVRGSFNYRFNFDGLFTYAASEKNETTISYVQVFHNGCIEAIIAFDLHQEKGEKYLHFKGFEKMIIDALPKFTAIQKKIGILPPLFILLSIMRVRGSRIAAGFLRPAEAIDRDDLIIPEIMLEQFDDDASAVMKPAFDAIWNAGGYPESLSYKDGKYKPN